jgi:type I restriction enzyme S subunit
MIKSKSIPQGWSFTDLKNVGEIVTGNTPSMKFPHYYGGDIPWVKPPDINKNSIIYSTPETLSDDGVAKARLLPKGAVLVTCIGNIGNVALAGVPLTTNQQINSIIFNSQIIDFKYGFYWCKTLKRWLIENSTSTTISMINKSRFGNAPFLIAPLKEQKRIADKLDNLYLHLDSLNGRLYKIPLLLKQFRENVLTQAITGKLIEVEFSFKKLGDLIVDIKYGTSKKSDYKTHGVPVLRIPNIKDDGTIDISDLKYAMLDKSEEAKLKLKENDILLIRSNGSISILGRSALVNKEIAGFAYAGYLIRVRCNEKLIFPAYLNNVLASPVIRKVIEGNARSTTGVNNINSEEVKALLIPFPTLENQRLIVAKVEQLFLIADKIERHYLTLNDILNNLPSTILSKAFKGELVDQNPEDEPASVLLQKITQMKAK